MTPTLRRILILICLLAVVLVAGFWLYSRGARASRPKQANQATTTIPGAPPPTPAPAEASSVAAEPITDFRAALERSRALRDPKFRSREFGRILRLWLERDFEGALAYVRQLPTTSSDYTEGVFLLLETVSRQDPDRALVLAHELVVTRDQFPIYSSLFAQFAQQDLSTAVQRLAQVPPGLPRENAVRALVDVWVRRELSAALTWAENLTDPADRAVAFEVVVTEVAAIDPRRAIDLAQKSLTGAARQRAVFHALQRLTETDPRSAAALVVLLPPGETQTLAAVDVARAFATQDVEAALAWAKTLPVESDRRLAARRTLEVWVKADPTAASRYVASLAAGEDQRDSARAVAGALAAINPQSALVWAQSLPSPEARSVAVATIADTWAQRDPAAATRWAAAQPANSITPEAVNASLSYWVLQDPGAAQEFVRTLAPSAQVSAAEYLAPLLSQTNPADALAWAQSLPHPQAQERALAAAYARWRTNAPAAAQAWLTSAPLAPELKSRLQPAP